jgi:hypothetical protein
MKFSGNIQKVVLRGLIVSSGDLTESLSTKALGSLNAYLDSANEEQLTEFASNFFACWQEDEKNLVAKPILKVLDEFLGNSLEKSSMFISIIDLDFLKM